jgi:hypothetical protein
MTTSSADGLCGICYTKCDEKKTQTHFSWLKKLRPFRSFVYVSKQALAFSSV